MTLNDPRQSETTCCTPNAIRFQAIRPFAQLLTLRPFLVEYKLQITKQEFSRFLFCQGTKQGEKDEIHAEFCLFQAGPYGVGFQGKLESDFGF